MANIYAMHKPENNSGGGMFLKLADGEQVKLRIASEPAIFESESRPDEQGNTRISTRYAWVVWNRDKNTAQIFEQSATFFKQVAAYAQDDDYGDPLQYDLKVKREGTGLETTYSVTPSPTKEPLGVKELDAVKNIDLIEKLSASPFYQRVSWLSEFEGKGNTPAPAPSKPKDEPSPEQRKAIDDLGGDPISLEDIPFN